MLNFIFCDYYGVLSQPPPTVFEIAGEEAIGDATLIPPITQLKTPLQIQMINSTNSFGHDHAGSCVVTSSSPDTVYKIKIEKTSTGGATIVLDINTIGSGYDTVLILFNETQQQIACDDDGISFADPFQIIETLNAG